MSRSGYSDDCDDQWAHIRWRGQVASSIRGQRGQRLFKELAEAMDAMPEKRLIRNKLQHENSFCTLGVVGAKRGIDMKCLDPEDSKSVSKAFDISEQLSREIVYLNDDFCDTMTPEGRWEFMREWVQEQIK